MLTQITIKNFGLIDSLSIEFQSNLNILTGETGAGKSIIFDALRYSLGDRITSSQVRDPKSPCIVETVFDLSKKQLLEYAPFREFLNDDETTLIINRTFNPDGKNKNKINGFNVTLTQLKELGNHLVDFHGANDHQMLLDPKSHLSIVDRLSKIETLKTEYSQNFAKYIHLKNKIDKINEIASSRDREIDLLSHQIKELEQVPLDSTSYEECVNEHTRISNIETLCEDSTQLLNLFEGGQYSISEILGQSFPLIRSLTNTDPSTSNISDILNQIKDSTDELSTELRNYLDNLSFDPENAKSINTRYDIYIDILRKYGPSIEDAAEFHEGIKDKFDLISNLETNKSNLKKEIIAAEKDLRSIAAKISSQRKKTATLLKTTIENELRELGIVHVQFECRIEKAELNENGFDSVLFYISPNAGEALKPLWEIVSSGEAARLMLALKKALTKVDPIPVLVFDEIDAQIGGRLGTITGKKLKEISQNRQVILITHLAQIASFAHSHFKVLKKVKDNRTQVHIELLNSHDRILELAHMMGGDKKSNISIKHAHDMLDKARI